MTLPGDVLSAGFLEQFGITQETLAERLGVSIEVAFEILVGTRAIAQEMAARLVSLFRMSPEFWIGLEQRRAERGPEAAAVAGRRAQAA